MSVSLKINLGTINYTEFIHVSVCKVSAPTVVSWEDWIPVPVTNYNFVVPGLDPDVYYVNYYDASTDSDMGAIVSQFEVSALTNEYQYEIRHYTCGGPNPGDPADGDSAIVDPYFGSKTITDCFQESFRSLKPGDEYDATTTPDTIALLNGHTFSTGEVFTVTIKYATGVLGGGGSSTGGLYAGTMDVADVTKTLVAGDKNKRVRLTCATTKQAITLCTLASLTIDDGFYFDNSCGGKAIQVKIFTNGGDRILYSGFDLADDEFAEFWVGKGEKLLLRKVSDLYWECILDYAGVGVGKIEMGMFYGQAGYLPFDFTEVDGDEYGRLWWYINNVLPNTSYITDDAGVVIAARVGQFIIKPTTKKILLPNWQDKSVKGLKDFDAYGADATRLYDYPGGFQAQKPVPHRHHSTIAQISPTYAANGPSTAAINYYNAGAEGYLLSGRSDEPTCNRSSLPYTGTDSGVGKIVSAADSKGAVDNIGVIFMVKI
jgi:hypothetical protein